MRAVSGTNVGHAQVRLAGLLDTYRAGLVAWTLCTAQHPGMSSSGGHRSIDDILMPGGKAIGVKGTGPRASARLREVRGGQAQAERLFNELSEGGTDITPAGYPGTLIELPDGRGRIGYRPASKSGPPTIDVNAVDAAGRPIPIEKIKFVDCGEAAVTADDVLESLAEECAEDHVGLWRIINAVRFDLGSTDPGETRALTLCLVQRLLQERGTVVGQPTSDGRHFTPWGLSPELAVNRIENEWAALGRDPDIGDVAWFTSPS
jgi:hypothetical protein